MHSGIAPRATGSFQLHRGSCTAIAVRKGVKRARLQGQFRASVGGPASSPDESGDPEVQDTLVKLVKLQVGAEQVKARAAEGSETLRQTAEEAKEELEKLRQIATDRSNLGFGSALADVNQAADEVAEMLRQSRAKIEADDADFEQWQYNMARRRSEGQFFQSLYQAEKPGTRQSTVSREPAPQQTRSPLTQNIFAFLTAVLVVTVIAGIAASMGLSLWFGRPQQNPPPDPPSGP